MPSPSRAQLQSPWVAPACVYAIKIFIAYIIKENPLFNVCVNGDYRFYIAAKHWYMLNMVHHGSYAFHFVCTLFYAALVMPLSSASHHTLCQPASSARLQVFHQNIASSGTAVVVVAVEPVNCKGTQAYMYGDSVITLLRIYVANVSGDMCALVGTCIE